MKLSNRQLMPTEIGGNGLISGLSDLGKKDLPIKVSYWVKKMSKFALDEFKCVSDARISILNKYAELGADGKPLVSNGSVVIKDVALAAKEVEELYSIVFDFPFDKLKADALGLDKISPDLLSKLEPILEE